MDNIISQVKHIGEKFNFTRIVLFGSRARGDNNSNSDIDLAVFAKDCRDEGAFRSALEEIDTLLKFDVVFITNTIEDEFFKNINRDGVVIVDRFKTKLENFQRAAERLKEAIDEYAQINSETVRDGVIQRFEFTVELSWKTLREYMIDQGYQAADSPKAVMKEAFAHGLIKDDKVWIDMLTDRNLTSHIYKDETAQRIFESIVSSYAHALEDLARMLAV